MSGRMVVFVLMMGLLLSGCQSRQHSIGARPIAADVSSSSISPSTRRESLAPLFGETRARALVSVPAAPCPTDKPITNPHHESYRLDTGDVVRVDVFEQAELSRLYRIDGGGFISVPLIGAVPARNLTTSALEREIAAGLSQSYLRDPKVNVEISSYRPFYILGEVRNSGQYPFVVGMTVETAVAIAGGYSPRANETRVEISRRIDDRLVRKIVPMNTEIRPGDTVKILERLF